MDCSDLNERALFVTVQTKAGQAIPWPALLFDNYKQMYDEVKRNGWLSTKEQSRMFYEHFPKLQANPDASNQPLLFLVGKKTGIDRRLVLAGEEAEKCNFIENVSTLASQPELNSNSRWMAAIKTTLDILKDAWYEPDSDEDDEEDAKPAAVAATTSTNAQTEQANVLPASTAVQAPVDYAVPVATMAKGQTFVEKKDEPATVDDENVAVVSKTTAEPTATTTEKAITVETTKINDQEATNDESNKPAVAVETASQTMASTIKTSGKADSQCEPKKSEVDTASKAEAAENKPPKANQEEESSSKKVKAKAVSASSSGRKVDATPNRRDRFPTKAKSAAKKSSAKSITRKTRRTAAADVEASTEDMSVASSSKTSVKNTPAFNSSNKRKMPVGKPSTVKKVKLVMSEPFILPKFATVRHILVKMGFSFSHRKYCRPDGEEVGRDVFHSLADFHAHLCCHGVNGNVEKATEAEQELVERWVRYAIVKSAPSSGSIPALALLDSSTVRKLLNRLGFTHVSLNDSYALPGVERRECILGENCFTYDGHDDASMQVYLARHGLPEYCDFAAISKQDRLRLELYFAGTNKVDTFKTTFSAPMSPRSRRNYERQQSKRHSPTPTVVSRDDSMIAATESAARQRKQGRSSEKRKAGTDNSSSKVKAARGSPTTPVATRALPVSPMTTRRQTIAAARVSLSPVEPREMVVLPDKAATVGEKLDACREALAQSHNGGAPTLDLPENSAYRRNMQGVMRFLKATVDSEGSNSGQEGRAASLYVCGGPGIGKTSGVRYCLDQVVARALKNDDPDQRQPTVCYYSATTGTSDPLLSIRRAISAHLGLIEGIDQSTFKKRLTLLKQFLILVVDEVDHLIDGKLHHTNLSKGEKALSFVCKLAADEEFPLALVGIANTTGNDTYDRLQEIAKFGESIIFQRYSKDELMGILKSRVGTTTIKEPALSLVATTTAEFKGDARYALDMVASAVENCRQRLKGSLGRVPAEPVVNSGDVLKAMNDKKNKLKGLIEGMPMAAKVMLCIAVTLSEIKVKNLTLGLLKQFVSSGLKTQPDEILDTSTFNVLLEMLVESDLLVMKKKAAELREMDAASVYDERISIPEHLQDIKVLIEEEFNKHASFYDGLREHAKTQARMGKL